MRVRAEARTLLEALTAISDEALVERVKSGETALYELLMRRHNPRLYRVARTIVKNDVEAEDVMQEAYVRAYANLSQFKGEALFSTWLTRIAVHEALARSRDERRLTLVEQGPQPRDEAPRGPEHDAVSHELRKLLASSIEALEEPYRLTFVLRDVNEMSTAEVADCLGITEQAVKTRLHRARSLLRQVLLERTGASAFELFPFHASRCDKVVAAVLAKIL
jgi:RNA polymerase sigma-70 factor (ECF subfamily)